MPRHSCTTGSLRSTHPFADGNGRVESTLEPVLDRERLSAGGGENGRSGSYYRFLRSADAGDLVPFTNFIAKAVGEGLTLYLSVFGGDD